MNRNNVKFDYNKNKRLISLLICCIGIIIFIFDSICPNTVYAAADSTGSDGELHAFYPAYASYSEQIQNYIDSVDSLSFAWSRIDAVNPGELNTVKGQNGNTSFYYPSDYLQPVEYAKSKGKSIQLSIYMSGSDGIKLLPYSEKRELMVNAITQTLQKDITQGKEIYYDGVVIDFEGLRDTDGNKNTVKYEGKQISTYFTQFLQELKTQLNITGKKLYVAVNPRLYYDGYDYTKILKVADRVILMAHDYEPSEKLSKNQVMQYTGYDTLKPINSMAPMAMIRQALNDMKSAATSKSDLSKVWLQICFDSAQWKYEINGPEGWNTLDASTLSKEGRVTPLYKSIKDRVDNADGNTQKLSYGYNNELQNPYIQYYNTLDKTWNIILYEGSNSITAKVDQAKAYGLGGISVWSLSNVPDYNDSNGQKYHLNGWTALLSGMKSFTTLSADSKQKVSFTDKAVEKTIRTKLGKSTGSITKADLNGIYRLKLLSGVKSFKDMAKLKNLEYLDASNLSIKSVAGVESLKNLRVLYLQRNRITDITPLKKLTRLSILSLNGNRISNLKPITNLTSLEKLYLKENKITNIASLKTLVNLKELYLSGNQISDYSPVKKIYSRVKENCDFKIK